MTNPRWYRWCWWKFFRWGQKHNIRPIDTDDDDDSWNQETRIQYGWALIKDGLVSVVTRGHWYSMFRMRVWDD